MVQTKRMYRCQSCEETYVSWSGLCSACGEWDTIKECVVSRNKFGTRSERVASELSTEVLQIAEIQSPNVKRLETGISELDNVLGGGLVKGSVVLIGGDPGIGKSTLMMQLSMAIAEEEHCVIYATSEESAYQSKMRAVRLNSDVEKACSKLYIIADTNLDNIEQAVETHEPSMLIIDSIQMLHQSSVEKPIGSTSQIQQCCMSLIHLARERGICVCIVGHMTKEGLVAGPRMLEHMVDVVLSFEGDRHDALRGLRSIKNRFGTTLEIGLFEMTAKGLHNVDDVASFLLQEEHEGLGSIVCPVMHGSRCLLVEVQALTAGTLFGQARRRATGFDSSRLTRLTAVLEQHAGLEFVDQDVYANIVGGLQIREPATDLAICCAIICARLNMSLPRSVAMYGEIGLDGRVRNVPHREQRVKQIVKRGFSQNIVPITRNEGGDKNLTYVASVGDLVTFIQKNGISIPSNNRLSDGEKSGFNGSV